MAQEVKHTPGPWHLNADTTKLGVAGEIVTAETTIASVNMWEQASNPGAPFANARLIAAAPEMHRELRGCRCPRPFNSRPDEFTIGECVDAGECGCSCGAAIIKAEGRS